MLEDMMEFPIVTVILFSHILTKKEFKDVTSTYYQQLIFSV